MERQPNEPWQHRAQCLGEDPELFFPIGETGPYAFQIEEAKLVCRRCSVQEKCLEQALSFNSEGVWGATTERERRAIKKRNDRLAKEALAKLAG